MATGVSGERPAASRRRAISSSRLSAMKATTVPPPRPSAAQSMLSGRLPASSWPVTKVTALAMPRWVRGMPAAAGAARPALTPGTTRQGMPAAVNAAASSPPRAKRKGSPPFSRTTRCPARAPATSRALIFAWDSGAAPLRLPTGTSVASGLARRSTPRPGRASWSTRSARRSASAARRVSSDGSPGPAPTSQTSPGRGASPAASAEPRSSSVIRAPAWS